MSKIWLNILYVIAGLLIIFWFGYPIYDFLAFQCAYGSVGSAIMPPIRVSCVPLYVTLGGIEIAFYDILIFIGIVYLCLGFNLLKRNIFSNISLFASYLCLPMMFLFGTNFMYLLAIIIIVASFIIGFVISLKSEYIKSKKSFWVKILLFIAIIFIMWAFARYTSRY